MRNAFWLIVELTLLVSVYCFTSIFLSKIEDIGDYGYIQKLTLLIADIFLSIHFINEISKNTIEVDLFAQIKRLVRWLFEWRGGKGKE